MNSSISIDTPKLIRAWRKADESQQKILREILPLDFFTNINRRIESFEDAVNFIGEDDVLVLNYRQLEKAHGVSSPAASFLELLIVNKACNLSYYVDNSLHLKYFPSLVHIERDEAKRLLLSEDNLTVHVYKQINTECTYYKLSLDVHRVSITNIFGFDSLAAIDNFVDICGTRLVDFMLQDDTVKECNSNDFIVENNEEQK